MDAAEIAKINGEALAAARSANSTEELEVIRIKYLGRKGLLPAIMKGLKDLDPSVRAEVGKGANELKKALTGVLAERKAELAGPAAGGGRPVFDCTLPGTWRGMGTMHPISLVIAEAIRIFGALGFTVAEGPDVETRYRNFEALNTADHHPSLDPRDTFWLDTGECLRTQTSPVQIRVMESRPPPVRIITPGRCYRRDTTDATHSANFYQMEGLYVDEQVSLADLKGVLTYYARRILGPDVGVRFRPHYFPFTEPSVEVDFSCHVCGGAGCRVCKHNGWIEIGGAGMVDPRVFKKVGYDADKVTGYAFGMGIERIAMVKYGIEDLRTFYENDLRFLEQFV